VTLFATTAAPIAEPVRAVLMTHVRAWVGSARRLSRWLKALEPRARLEMDPLLAPQQWLDLGPLRPPRSRKGTEKRASPRQAWRSKEST
jgi:hypothetical protein